MGEELGNMAPSAKIFTILKLSVNSFPFLLTGKYLHIHPGCTAMLVLTFAPFIEYNSSTDFYILMHRNVLCYTHVDKFRGRR